MDEVGNIIPIHIVNKAIAEKKVKLIKKGEKMRKFVEQVDNEGLDSLLGERVLLMCAGYFYEGKLIGVNNDFVKIDDAHIVYSTGKWSDKNYEDTQKLHTNEWYVMRGLIESFGKSK